MDTISVVIPVRDRGLNRLKIVCDYLEPQEIIKEIIIVDYCSKKEIKLNRNKVKVIRYNKNTPFNKAHAINIGAKKAKGEYIMLLDADIILPSWFFNSNMLLQELKPNNFIYSKNVKRIKIQNVTTEEEMKKNSWDWGEQNNSYLYKLNHTGTGGVQIFSREWFMDIRGIDENLVYYGGMDNITLCDALEDGLNLINLNSIIFHIEHDMRKEDNLPKDERELAKFIRSDRGNLLNMMLSSNEGNNPGYFGRLSGPNCPILKEYKKLFDLIKEEKKKTKTFELTKSPDTKILIVPATNREELPIYFIQDLMKLFDTTRKYFNKTDILYLNACDINHLRNLAIDYAISHGFDYLVMLDTDHNYNHQFILRLLAHNKDFVTGLTINRTAPLHYTQYYKIDKDKKNNYDKNYVKPNGKLQKIEASGPVGMLMNVNVLKYLPRPWFKMDYKSDTNKFDTSGDFYFSKMLKEFNYDLWVDTSIEFPHHATVQIKSNGLRLPITDVIKKDEKKFKKEYAFLPSWVEK